MKRALVLLNLMHNQEASNTLFSNKKIYKNIIEKLLVKIFYYFASYTADKGAIDSCENLINTSKKFRNVDFIPIFRYEFDFLKEKPFSTHNKVIIFENEKDIDSLTTEDVSNAETELGISFKLFRKMTSLKYTKRKGYFDDKILAMAVLRWSKIFAEHKPDLFFTGHMDDAVGNIGLILASRYGIKIITIRGGGFESSYNLADVNYQPIFYKKGININREFNLAYKKWEGNFVRNKIIEEKNAQLFKLKSSKIAMLKKIIRSLKRYYIDKPKIERNLWASPFHQIMKYFRFIISVNIARFLYEEPKKEKYYLFPLTYIYDSNLFVLLPNFNLTDIVSKIAEMLPKDTYLYLRSHPHWKNADISIKDMIKIRMMKNVKMIKYDISLRDLIKNSLGVIVANSSTMYDGLFLDKAVYSIGTMHPEEITYKLDKLLDTKISKEMKRKRKEYIAKVFAHLIKNNPENYSKGDFDPQFSENLIKNIIMAGKEIKATKRNWPKITDV